MTKEKWDIIWNKYLESIEKIDELVKVINELSENSDEAWKISMHLRKEALSGNPKMSE